VEAIDLERCGAALEVDPAFPARTNVHFVQALSPTHLVMRVWERGAGPTLACGTGACATLVVAHRFGLAERRARIDLPGGPLEIDWDPASDHLFMTGPAVAVFDGVVTPELWGDDPADVSLDGVPGAVASVDCASVCVNGCIRPEACPSAEARARVQALLNNRSLDDLVALATESLETRTRARFERTMPPGG
jgi:diaminopimelate epimerase